MQTRRPLIAGNWKMHKTAAQAVEFVRAFKETAAGASDVEAMIAPPFTALDAVAAPCRENDIALGAQNMHWETRGAFTGEISAEMLKQAGCRYVILGHSERRQFFGETDAQINRKIGAATKAGLAPVFCIGESEAQRDAGETFSVLDKQVRNGLEALVPESLESLVMAYEPIWAIGTGKTATTAQAQEVHAFLREQLASQYSPELAKGMRILYGGSVKPSNIRELMTMPDIDGALVGGASLDPKSFGQLVNYKK